jgi:molybdopterin molybdotransferase
MKDGMGPVFKAIDRSVKALGTETKAVLDTFGCVAACAVRSPQDLPARNISALDGFVVKGPGDTFVNAGIQEMGRPPVTVREGKAVFVPTGAPLPRTGRFVKREHVLEQDGGIIRTKNQGDERKEWERGSWLKKGTRIIEKGQTITPLVMGDLSLAGITTLEVYRQACAAIMTTGDELRSGVVPDSNRYLLAGLIQADRGLVHHVPTAPDRLDEMTQRIRSALRWDLLVITGGTALGKKDITREALKGAGATFLIDRPRIDPGRTMAFGLLGEIPFFLLPGNPKSVATLYGLFVRPCLMRLQGVRELRNQG